MEHFIMDPIYVTKTFLPPLEEYIACLREIWDTNIVTKDGPFLKKFEKQLKNFSNVKYVIPVVNGTIALQLAIKALDLKGEVLTTPFTFVATSGALVWERCTPVFIDIDPDTLNLDPDKIANKITRQTSAILPVHVYGNPCDIDRIEAVAQKYNLKTIYDAAHAFGSLYRNRSVFAYGDVTMASFQATKALHTVEGGAIFTNNNEIAEKIWTLSYFGMAGSSITRDGTNAKLNELCAAMGILNLKYFEQCTKIRQSLYNLYLHYLKNNDNIRFQTTIDEINYSYFPVIFKSNNIRETIVKKLNNKKIFPREYFSPSLETVFSAGPDIDCPIAFDISKRILCLPLSTYITADDVDRICRIINS